MPFNLSQTFTRRRITVFAALAMLVVPAFVTSLTASAQRRRAAATPTPKKKTTPTPKKAQAKTKPTPTPAKSKTNAKTQAKPNARTSTKETASKSKKDAKTTNSRDAKKAAADRDKNNKNSRNAKAAANSKTGRKDEKPKPTTARTASDTRAKTVRRTETRPVSKPVATKSDPKPEKPTASTDVPQVIVTTYSVPVRGQAKADAPAVGSARLGTVMTVVDKTPAWYKVQYSSGGKPTTGWISANSTSDLTSSKKSEIYAQIAERNYDSQMDFAKSAEFYDFASRVDGDLDNADKSADVGLKRLLALRSALKTIPADKRDSEPYRNFLKTQEKEIVYNEPAGQYLVAANSFWNLHEKYKKSVVSDRIAWEAANNPLPGECEGYVNCYLFDMRMRFGEYLNLHPNGKSAPEALKHLTDYLSPIVADSSAKQVYNGPTDVTDRAEFNNLIAELRTIVARLPFVEKEKALGQLRTIAEAYR